MPRRWLRLVCAALWVGPLAAAAAGDAARLPLNEYHQQTWTSSDGLPHNLITDLAQSEEGYLWLATWEGAVRYNGHGFDVIDEQTINGLPDRGITELEVDARGRLLIGTARGGMVRRDRHRWEVITTDHDQRAPSIYSFASQGEQTLIGTAGNGVLEIAADGRVYRPPELEPLRRAVVFAMLDGGDGSYWFGTDAGLVRWQPGELKAFGHTTGLPDAAVLSLAFDQQKQLIVGTERGAFRFQAQRAELLHPRLAAVSAESLLRDRLGDLWIGTAAEGLFRLSPLGLEQLDSRNGLPSDRVPSLLEDREASVWIGTSAGLFRLRQAPFRSLTQEQGLAGDYVRTLLEDRAGRLWVGTSDGLSALDREGRLLDLSALQLPKESVLSLAPSGEDGLWIGTYYEGLLQWRPGQPLRRFDRDSGLPAQQVRSLLATTQGTVWAGTSGGLVRLRDQNMTVYRRGEGLPDNTVLALYQARDGQLWVGTQLGIAVGDAESGGFRSVQDPLLQSVQRIYGFSEDAQGALWVASDRGVLRYADGRWQRLGPAQGLPFASVFAVVQDGEGNYWLSSNRGVLRIPGDSLQAVLQQPGTPLQSELFSEADGMASAQCNGAAGTPTVLRQDGSLWFATAKGVTSIQPENLTAFPRLLPAVVLEGARVDGFSRELGERLQVEAAARRVELSFVGLSFQAPQRIRYRYRLEGFDEDWVFSERSRVAQYTNLAPGRYRFRGSAANPSGDWSPHEAVIELDVAPHWWQRTPVQWAGLLGLIGLLWLAYAIRLRVLRRNEQRLRRDIDQATANLRNTAAQLQEQNLELDAYAHTVAHDLKTPLTTILGLARVLEHSPGVLPAEVMQNSVQRIHGTAQKMASIIDALLLLSQARGDQPTQRDRLDQEELVREAQSRLQELIVERDARIEVETLPPALGYAPWVEEIWVNFLSNALKYGGERPRILIGAEGLETGMVRYFVRDFGPGIDNAARQQLFQPFSRIAEVAGDGHGLGLSIVRRIVERMGGEVGCDSEPGAGASFWFTLPAVPRAADRRTNTPVD